MTREISSEVLWRTVADASDAISAIAKMHLAIPLNCALTDLSGDESKQFIEHLGSVLKLSDKITEIVLELDQRISDAPSDESPDDTSDA